MQRTTAYALRQICEVRFPTSYGYAYVRNGYAYAYVCTGYAYAYVRTVYIRAASTPGAVRVCAAR